MIRPLLRFVSNYDHFTVKVENLAQLSVAQIQELEKFASDRRGRLDFTSATINIRKHIDFDDFNRILELSSIKADTIESVIRRQNDTVPAEAVIDFGKYRGMHYSQIPLEYLLWLKKNYQGHERQTVEDELVRRNG